MDTPETKLVPFTVRVNWASPTVLEVGLMLVVVGTGLLTVNTCAFESPPPGVGLFATTLYVPGVAMSEARMAAVT